MEHPAGIEPAARDALLDWYAERGRPLAFRRTADPYAVLVSEAMAQQTQAARAAASWERFMARFPTVEILASASPAEVLRAWRGLGYDRRALALRRAAIKIRDEHGGRVPDSIAGARGAARRRPVHRPGGRGDRVRPARRSGRRQRPPRPRPHGRRRHGSAVDASPAGRRRPRRPVRPAGRLDPRGHGSRRHDLPPARAALRRVPGARLVPLRGDWRTGVGRTQVGRHVVDRRSRSRPRPAGFAAASSTGCGQPRATAGSPSTSRSAHTISGGSGRQRWRWPATACWSSRR